VSIGLQLRVTPPREVSRHPVDVFASAAVALFFSGFPAA
jgi:hypothetical protein